MKLPIMKLTPPLAALSVALCAVCGAQASVTLPDGYTRLECITASRSANCKQRIDTGIVPDSKTAVHMVFIPLSGASGQDIQPYFGTGSFANKNSFVQQYSKLKFYGNGAVIATPVLGARTEVTLTTNATGKLTVAIEGQDPIVSNPTVDDGLTSTLKLFAVSDTYSSDASLISFSMTTNGVPARDFLPCRREADEAIGLYDLVSGEFFGNTRTTAGAVPFEAGPKYEVVTVTGEPLETGVPAPGYGRLENLTRGETYSFEPPADGVDEESGVAWQCRGWRYERADGSVESGTGEATVTFDGRATLIWLFDVSYKVEFSAAAGGFATNTLWYARGSTATVAYEPAAGRAFGQWTGDVPALESRRNPLVLTVDGPKRIGCLDGRLIRVPADQPTIEDAFAAADDGDTVRLAPGTYAVTSTIEIGRPLVLDSEEGPAVTTLEVPSEAGLVRIVHLYDRDAVVRGLTLSGGAVPDASGNGGGVRIDGDGGLLDGCIVTNCQAKAIGRTGTTQTGGGFALVSDDGAIVDCLFVNNKAGGYGMHGIGAQAKGLVRGCVFRGNSTGYSNYGFSGGRISHCAFLDNVDNGTVGGGAITCSGGGVVDNVLVMGNASYASGKAAVAVASSATTVFSNCTFVANAATSTSGGVSVNVNGKPSFYGCVFANNTTVSGSGACAPEIDPGGGSYRYCFCTKPLPETQAKFCRSGEAGFAEDGFTPTLSSGWMDMCPPGDYPEFLCAETDVSGLPRLSGDGVDAGCAEYQYADVEVDFAAPERRVLVGREIAFEATASVRGATKLEYGWSINGSPVSTWLEDASVQIAFTEPGTNEVTLTVRADGEALTDDCVTKKVVVAPADAFVVPFAADHVPSYPYNTLETAATNVVDAVRIAADGTVVHVAAGTYPVCETVVLDYGVTLVSDGGAAVTTLEVPSVAGLVRILKLDHRDAVVRGLTLSGGAVPEQGGYGGGVQIAQGGGTLDGCVVTNCQALVVVAHSQSNQYGAGFALFSPDGLITNCVFRGGNTNSGWGWASIGVLTAGRVTHCVFEGNKGNYGLQASGGTVSHCVFRDNVGVSTFGGHAIYCGGSVTVDNSLFTGNSSVNGKGTVLVDNNGAPVFLNCTIVGNSTKGAGSGVSGGNSGKARFHNCIIQDNVVADASATTNISGSASYTFCACPEPLSDDESKGNVLGTVGFRAHHVPSRASVAANAGSVDGFEEILVGGTDLLGRPRVCSRRIDIGCCESPGDGLLLMMR